MSNEHFCPPPPESDPLPTHEVDFPEVDSPAQDAQAAGELAVGETAARPVPESLPPEHSGWRRKPHFDPEDEARALKIATNPLIARLVRVNTARFVHVDPDILQADLIVRLTRLNGFDLEQPGAAAYANTMAKNICLDQLRSRARRPRPTTLEVAEVVQPKSFALQDVAETVVNQAANSETLAPLLDSLSARHREIIELAFYREMTQPEIAKELGIPLGTVKSRMSYALRYLRQAAKKS